MKSGTRAVFAAVLLVITLAGCASPGKLPTRPIAEIDAADELTIAIGDPQWGTYLKITDVRSAPRLRYGYNQTGACVKGILKVDLDRTPKELIITPQPTMETCQKFRWRVKLDGSGAREQIWQDGRWTTSTVRPEMRIVAN